MIAQYLDSGFFHTQVSEGGVEVELHFFSSITGLITSSSFTQQTYNSQTLL